MTSLRSNRIIVTLIAFALFAAYLTAIGVSRDSGDGALIKPKPPKPCTFCVGGKGGVGGRP